MSVSSLADRHGVTVEIQKKQTDTLDNSGGRVETWGSPTFLVALFQVRSGTEAILGGGERSASIATVYFPGRPTVGIGDRIAYDAKSWEISSVRVPDERPATDSLCYTIVEVVEVNG
jgi:head-tail adaptor